MTAAVLPSFRAFSYHWLLYRRTWKGSIVIGLVNPLLFLTGIGIGIGKLIDANSGGVDGVDYLAWLAPGVLAASAMQMAFAGGGFAAFREATPEGSYASAAATPLSPTDIMVGQQLFATARVALLSAGFVVVQVALSAAPSLSGAALAVPAACLTGIAFSAPMAAWAVTVRRFTTLQTVFRFIVQPLYLLSGTFFPLTSAPEWLQKLAYLSPLWHGVQLCRGLSLGTLTARQLLVHGSVLIVLAAGGLIVARVTYRRRLHQ
ncbi:MAG: lipooligosaccharide transport system permease protein [Gaiellaceae bacterium]|jgi:lipooligosaccharide transport system permease protein|nr:lipooligosaccharide transport system permease protein [Gaiellaceae bacterium]